LIFSKRSTEPLLSITGAFRLGFGSLKIGALIKAVRDQTKTVDLKQVNAVLLQPHWRHNTNADPTEPVLIRPKNLPHRS